ncbi:MAG TPA: hypothetical protein VLT61_10790, partial [Anaeromyxobacteraceae bacterium]|nr:hypothetical protein [Anaeromyxobacteraceae bacterium]
MPAQQPKVLRVGVILGGKIVEERVLSPRQTVTVGTAAKNTIVIQQAGAPESFTLLSWSGDQYHLHFTEGSDGNVQSAHGQADFGALVAQGLAKKQGNVFEVPVSDGQRGKVVFGDVNLLWQFVAPPPEVPAPTLPKEAKGTHFQSMDRLFVTVLVISFLFHAGTYVALARTPLPPEVTLEEIPDRYAKVLIPEKLPKPPEPEKKEEGSSTKEEKQAKKAADEKKPAESAEQVAAKKAARAAAVAKAVQSKGILKVLGALGPGTGSGAVADVFGAGGGMSDVASALSGAGGVAVATDPGAGGGRKGGGQGGAASIGTLATSGGGTVGYGAKTE